MTDQTPTPWPFGRAVVAMAAVLVGLVVALDLATALPLPPDGLIGLVQLFAVHISLAALVLLPLALRGDARWLRLAFVALVLTGAVRFGSEWYSPPGPSVGATDLRVASFNLEVDSRPPAEAVAFLRGLDVDVITLQELTPAVADAIEADPVLAARFPSMAMFPNEDVIGLGVISRIPVRDARFEGGPSRLIASLDAPDDPIRLIVVHPLAPRVTRGPLGLPTDYSIATRTEALERIRDTIADEQAGDEPVVVIGDINTAPTEPAFEPFIAGLVDAHQAVGIGPGWTYRPTALQGLGIGLIRIDVVLSEPALQPTSVGTQCPSIGDHCAVMATLAR